MTDRPIPFKRTDGAGPARRPEDQTRRVLKPQPFNDGYVEVKFTLMRFAGANGSETGYRPIYGYGSWWKCCA
jgi:hypothetical protein